MTQTVTYRVFYKFLSNIGSDAINTFLVLCSQICSFLKNPVFPLISS